MTQGEKGARARGVGKYKGKGLFKVNKRNKYKVEGDTNFVNFFVMKISVSLFCLLNYNFKKN